MSDIKPLLSICIPTYNRSGYLEQCLESIVHQERFDEIEVIISDNCSTDDTEAVCKKYKSFQNIKYYKNAINVLDKNFSLSLERASGTLRKLTNDTVIYKSGAISYMLDAAKECLKYRKQVYFLSKGDLSPDKKIIDSLDDYINTVSFNLTWIRSLAIWEDDCKDLVILEDNSKSQMGQIPFLLSNFEKHNGAVIFDKPIMDTLQVEKKNLSYGLYKVFYESFLGFIKQYVDLGKISAESYENLRKDLLLDFFCNWILIQEFDSERYEFSDENLLELLDKAYCDDSYYKDFKSKLQKQRLKRKIKRIIGK